MIGTLKKLSGMEPVTFLKGYRLIKHWHPDSGKTIEFIEGNVLTLEAAQEICSRPRPESSFKEGETKDWYFIGYAARSSRTAHLKLKF